MHGNIQQGKSPFKSTKWPCVGLTRPLLSNSPIKHRNDPDDTKLFPPEFKVLTGLLHAAQVGMGQDRHARAFDAGQEAIRHEGVLHDEFKEDWRDKNAGSGRAAPQRLHSFDIEHPRFKPIPIKTAMRLAGKDAYREERKRLASRDAETAELYLSWWEILRWSDLSIGGKNKSRVKPALERLTRQVGDFPPPILELEEQDGCFRIVVNCGYFAPPFALVPKPMPQSPAALSFWLLVQNIKTGPMNKKTMLFASLCDLLGIPLHLSPAQAQREVERALQIVNTQLSKLPVRELHSRGVKVPKSYRIEAHDNHVRIVGQSYPQDEDGRLVLPKPKIARVRLTTKARERLDRQAEAEERAERSLPRIMFGGRLIRDRSKV